jgi:hypothetical protein
MYKDIPAIYPKTLKDNLIAIYQEKQNAIKLELKENITTNGSFSLTLDAWTTINQDAYLGIIM